jgi:hypothetical protein
MRAEGYSLDMYCDNKLCTGHVNRLFPMQYTGNTGPECRGAARRAGWKISAKTDLCPLCNPKSPRYRPTDEVVVEPSKATARSRRVFFVNKPGRDRDPHDFMERVRGVPSYIVARAFTNLVPGIDYGGCPKSHLAEVWADHFTSTNSRIKRDFTLDQIVAEVNEIIERKAS